MYDALAMDRIRIEQDLLRRRLEAAARFPRPEVTPATGARRRWWPRPRRLAVRWAMSPDA